MPTTSVFRGVLIAGLMFTILVIISGFSLVETLPPKLQEYLAESEAKAPSIGDITLLALTFAALIGYVVAIVGLWKFKRWARTLYVLITLILLLSTPLFGPRVMTGWEWLFDDIEVLLSGVALAMMFSGETGKMFQSAKAQSGS